MSPLPPDAAASLSRIADELAGLRAAVVDLTRQVGVLASDNATLRARLEHSETARQDLAAQTEHIVQILADARAEIRTLRGAPSA